MPTTWPEFFAVADKMKAAGIVAVAAGGQPWQDLALWEDVVLSQGADFYKKALVDLDQKTLTSDKMVQRVRHGPQDPVVLRQRAAPAVTGTLATRDGHQRQGRHAVHGRLGEGRIRQRRTRSRAADYVCAAVPGTEKSYTFNVDSFVFFQQKGQKAATPGQLALAKTIMTPEFQEQFSLNKGSIPVRLGVSMAKFDDCAKKAYADEQTAIKSGGYVPSLAHGMAQPDASSRRDLRRRHEVHELAAGFEERSDRAREGSEDQVSEVAKGASVRIALSGARPSRR